MKVRVLLALVAGVFSFALAPTPAHAGGLEFAAPGTAALGRGGAAYARPGDPMALWFNPANLADLQGIQLSLQTHLVLYEACHAREFGCGRERPRVGERSPRLLQLAGGRHRRWHLRGR
ncbi:MAG: hypothetical protein MUE69_14265 [Myxococcota bacterium]|nr:hypothetical protein [Myxococcota bacterium]